jgi:hypothetical protein
MPRRQKMPDTRPPSVYKYTGYQAPNGTWILAHQQCEEESDFHLFKPTVEQWPPRKSHPDDNDPYWAGRCELCGVNAIIYATNDETRTGLRVLEPERPTPKAKAVSA